MKEVKQLTLEEIKYALSDGVRGVDFRLRKILKEELGISDEVKQFVQDVVKFVNNKAKELFNVENGKVYEHTFEFLGHKVPASFRVFHCTDKNEEKELVLNNEYAANAVSACLYGGDIIVLNIPLVYMGTEPDLLKLYDDLQHEVSHIYQQIRSGHNYNPTEYEYSNKFLYSENQFENVLARIIYLCHPTEQDAYVNGLYGSVMHALSKGAFPLDKENFSAYIELQNLYKYYKTIIENKDNPQLMAAIKTLNTHGIKWNYKKYVNRCSEGIKEFERKIKRTLMKCEKDARLVGYSVRGLGDWLI